MKKYMTVYMRVEVSAEMFADLMSEDANFAAEVWQEIAERVEMGAMRDDAANICAGMSFEKASFLVRQISSLAEAMRSGFNMANVQRHIEPEAKP